MTVNRSVRESDLGRLVRNREKLLSWLVGSVASHWVLEGQRRLRPITGRQVAVRNPEKVFVGGTLSMIGKDLKRAEIMYQNVYLLELAVGVRPEAIVEAAGEVADRIKKFLFP